ncbi:MAG: hypothetical protein PHU40_03375 [Sulfurimonas sp.]|nr:hypothetical protein [Sulfurimonas sp.]
MKTKIFLYSAAFVLGVTISAQETQLKEDVLEQMLKPRVTLDSSYISETTLLRFGMIYSQSLIKLSDTSTIEAAGYIEAKDYMSNIGISYTFNPQITPETDILYSIKREFTLYNSAADEGATYSIDPSLGANFRLKYLF